MIYAHVYSTHARARAELQEFVRDNPTARGSFQKMEATLDGNTHLFLESLERQQGRRFYKIYLNNVEVTVHPQLA